MRLNISLRRWTPRTVCTARLGRPLSAQYIGAKRSSSIRGSASFRKTSAQLRSKRLAFFGGTRNSDCHRLTYGSRSRNMLTSPAQVQHLAASPHYPCLAPAWRGVFTNESIFISYYDVTSEDLRFAKTTSGGGSSDDWTRTTLDSEGDVGQFSSIAAAEESTVFIAYYDNTNRDLKSIRSTDGGSSFSSPVTVDSEDEVGMYASIAAIDTHMLFVSYYEANKRDLKFAKSAILVGLEGHRMSLRACVKRGETRICML